MSRELTTDLERGADPARILESIEVVVQPIVDIATGRMVAVEALARFGHAPAAAGESIFIDAHERGFGYAMEATCLRKALALRADLPSGVPISINLSPDVLHHPAITRCWPEDLDGVIVEVTEQGASNPDAFRDQIAHLRQRGAAIAVDDVSTGYAGLLRLATLRPDFVKIDRRVVAGVRDSLAQGAVLEALVTFSHRLGAAVIGEGVESLDDLIALAEYDVDFAQGWAIGRPAHSPAPIRSLVVQTCQAARRRMLRRQSPVGAASRTRDMHAVTAGVARASELAQLHSAVADAAAELEVDVIGVSLVAVDGTLREITTSGEAIDTSSYRLDEYPATRNALRTGSTIEVHLSDPRSDPAETDVLLRHGHASLLLVPIRIGPHSLGALEFLHREHRRWTTGDIAHARGLAEHLGHALLRIGV